MPSEFCRDKQLQSVQFRLLQWFKDVHEKRNTEHEKAIPGEIRRSVRCAMIVERYYRASHRVRRACRVDVRAVGWQ